MSGWQNDPRNNETPEEAERRERIEAYYASAGQQQAAPPQSLPSAMPVLFPPRPRPQPPTGLPLRYTAHGPRTR